MAGAGPSDRRLLVRGVARTVATVVLMVAAYYLAPLDGWLGIGPGIGFVLGLVALVALVVRQVRAILTSDTPRLQAVQALAVALPLFVVLFAATYTVLSRTVPGSFTEDLSRTDALYFTVTVLATVGFGDISPVGEAARLVTTGQMVLGLFAAGVVLRIVLGAVRVAVQRREGEERRGGPGA